MNACRRCHGTGVEPGQYITDRWGQKYRVHPSKTCPVCHAPLMLGDPFNKNWHCSRLDGDKSGFVEHYKASLLASRRR